MLEDRRAIVFLAWGKLHVKEVLTCIESSKLRNYQKFLITDQSTYVQNKGIDLEIIRADFKLEGNLRKAEIIDYLPKDYSLFLFLDSDTRIIDDIELGFQKAKTHGIAIAQAAHYSLDFYWGFDKIMGKENINTLGQLQYNTGVYFFSCTDRVIEVFELYKKLAFKYKKEFIYDQPFLTLAMEKLEFNPYSLSSSFNSRGFNEVASGIIRIWHSHRDIPKDINKFKADWPLRRIVNGKVKNLPKNRKRILIKRIVSKLISRWR